MRNSNSKSRRARTNVATGDQVAFQPATPISAAARSGGAEAAFALAEALKLGGDIGRQNNVKASQRAVADFQRGAIEENSSQAYDRTITSLRAKARWIEDEAAFDEAFEDVDKRDLSIGDINTALDEIFAQKYGDLDDPRIAAEVVPKMQEYRERKIAEALKIQDEAEIAEAGAAITTIAEDAYRRGQNEDGSFEFDYQGLNETVQGVLKGAPGNSTMFSVIKDIAIRNGDVDFIRGVPERWEDGTPTFMSDPAFNEQVLDAENRAIAEAIRKDKLREAALEDASKEEHRRATVDAAVKAVNGVRFDDELDVLLQNGQTKYTDITGLEAARRSGLSEREERSWDEGTVTNIWAQITSGSLSVMDIVAIHDQGLLGYGPQSSKLAESMIRMADQHARAGSNDTTGTFQNYKSLLNGRYNKQQDGVLSPIDPKMGPLNVEANELFVTLQVDQNLTPRQAYDKVVEQFDPVADRIKAGISGKGSQTSQAADLGLSISQTQVTSYLDGAMTIQEFMGVRSADEFMIQIANSGLDQQTLDAVADKYLEDIAAIQPQQ